MKAAVFGSISVGAAIYVHRASLLKGVKVNDKCADFGNGLVLNEEIVYEDQTAGRRRTSYLPRL